MKLLGFDIKRSAPTVEQGNGTGWLTNILDLMESWGLKSPAGVVVNEDKALTIGAVNTSIRIISSTIASLPLFVYRRGGEGGGRELAARHWAYPLLHDSPNEYHTSYTWRETLVAHLLLWGDSFNRIEWLGNGSAGALYPLMPWQVEVKLTSKGVKYYQVLLPDGREDLGDDEVLHVPGLSYDGLRGLSVIGKMRDALGLTKAAENLASTFFSNGAKPGWNLQVPGRMSAEAQLNLAKSLAERFASKDALGVLVTEEGSKLIGPLTMPLKDAQFLEMRKYQRSEIFGWYGVPPHLAGDTEKSTSWGTGIEQMDIGYAKHTIRPRCVSIEQEINRKLFGRGSGLYCEFDLNGLQRGDFKSRIEALMLATGRPFLTGNEARDLEGWNKSIQADMDTVALPLNTGAGGSGGDGNGGGPNDPGGSNSQRAAPRSPDVHVHVHERPMEPPKVTVHTPAPIVRNELHMPAPKIDVHNRIETPESPRPIVHVENRVEPAPPAPVEVTVNLPPRRTVSEIERDKDGDITRVVQTERTA
jgi:HK97 family phage portal protein